MRKCGFFILFFALCILSGCKKSGDDSKNYLNENIELKSAFYSVIDSLQTDSSYLKFGEIYGESYDSILLFPSYTSIKTIKSITGDIELKAFENREFLFENEDLILFKRNSVVVDYFRLDSIVDISDIQNFKYPINQRMYLKLFSSDSTRKWGYISPMNN